MSSRGIRPYGRVAFPAGLLLTQCIACVLHAQEAPGYRLLSAVIGAGCRAAIKLAEKV